MQHKTPINRITDSFKIKKTQHTNQKNRTLNFRLN